MIPVISPHQASTPTSLALGSFDGLHAGHRSVIKAIVNHKEIPTVASFWPHPREILYKESRLRLDLPDEKKFLLEEIGVKQLVLIPFDINLSRMSAEDFLKEIILKKLNPKRISVGENFQFGHQRKGDIHILKEILKDLDIDINIQPIFNDQLGRVSSSRIRSYLSEGDLISAKKLLNRAYTFTGKVVQGKGIGKKIGWPTANLQIDGRKFLPGLGVYACWVYVGNSSIRLPSIMNLGPQPTIHPDSPSAVEVHILNREINLKDMILKVEPIKRIRSQKKFDSLESLSKEINQDSIRAREILFK